jgi:UDP-glucose 4-epimerase
VKALVTGGAGFVGGAVVQALLDEGHSVVVVDNLSSGTLDQVPDGATFVELSVGDATEVTEVLTATSFDVCFHFAGLIAAGTSMEEPETFFANNVGETLSLLRCLVEAGVERFVFSSSAAVYGEPLYTPIDESHRTETVSPYGESKLLVEHSLAWLARLGRIRYAALRYFNAAGAVHGRPELHVPESHLIPLALEVAAGERASLDLYGNDYPTPDGTCIRDYIHVADLATAHVAAADVLGEETAFVCNLGTGTGSSNAEVVAAVRNVTGRDVAVRVAARRPGDSSTLVAANDLARSVLGWEPVRSSLEEIVSDAWAARVEAGVST